jgi:DNA polymerase I-like protein with 3'-5' exonuclease and polymerase domains
VLQVHDSLVVECPPRQEVAVTALLRDSMEGAASLSVPLAVHVKSGATFEDI